MRRMAAVVLGAAMLVTQGLEAERHRSDVAEADVRLEGDGLEQSVHCHHNAVYVLGSGSRLTIEGSCTKVVVEGSRNWMEVEYADVIETKGSMNSVLFLSPRTRTVDRGRANDVAPKWQQ